ncbi:FKBP-type peptidyl-prolyl cis-trans isomerase SlyD [Arsenophonus endosymbiont of Bemisia tabaci Q2]|nr:FKBP-type peptidyl-prolyl cis-trans isomerase SlyD [Arsenophonus endosymbiont of Bemisia tabaci Q2]
MHGRGSLISALEKALERCSVGEHFDIEIQADDAYGQYDENLVQRVPKDVFVGVDDLQVGIRFLADTDMGSVSVEITGIQGDEVIVDGNHMLAGQNLKFNVKIIAIREATEEELAHGHVHSEDAHEGGFCNGKHHGDKGCSHGHVGCGCGFH